MLFNYFFMFEIILHIHSCSLTNSRSYAHSISAICLPKLELSTRIRTSVFSVSLCSWGIPLVEKHVCTFITRHRQLQKLCLVCLAWVRAVPCVLHLNQGFTQYCMLWQRYNRTWCPWSPSFLLRAAVFPQLLVREITASYYKTLSQGLLSLDWAFLTGECGESWQTYDLTFV